MDASNAVTAPQYTGVQSPYNVFSSFSTPPITGVQQVSQTYLRYNRNAYSGVDYSFTQGTTSNGNLYTSCGGGNCGEAGTGWETDSKGNWVRYGTFAMVSHRDMDREEECLRRRCWSQLVASMSSFVR